MSAPVLQAPPPPQQGPSPAAAAAVQQGPQQVQPMQLQSTSAESSMRGQQQWNQADSSMRGQQQWGQADSSMRGQQQWGQADSSMRGQQPWGQADSSMRGQQQWGQADSNSMREQQPWGQQQQQQQQQPWGQQQQQQQQQQPWGQQQQMGGDAESNNYQNPQQQQYQEESENQGGDEDVLKDYTNSLCHNLDPCDALVALVCPCVTYSDAVEELEPEDSRKPQENWWSTGCVVWGCMMGLTALAIEVPLALVPGACSWFPTTYFGGVVDARQLLLVLSYFVPHCACHFPLRYKLLGNEENVCMSCLLSVACSCCSLGVVKSAARDSQLTLDHSNADFGRWWPAWSTLYPRAPLIQAPEQTNQMFVRTSTRFDPTLRYRHFYSENELY